MDLYQESCNCADFDVLLDGEAAPAFRLLLPEHIYGEGMKTRRAAHTVAGDWTLTPSRAEGSYDIGGDLHL